MIVFLIIQQLIEVQQMVNQSRSLAEKLSQLKEKMTHVDEGDQQFWEFVNQAEKIKV